MEILNNSDWDGSESEFEDDLPGVQTNTDIPETMNDIDAEETEEQLPATPRDLKWKNES